MKKFFLIAIISVLILPVIVLIGGYFYLNLIYIPKALLPQIKNQVSAQLKKDFSISGASFNYNGNIIIKKPKLKDTQGLELGC